MIKLIGALFIIASCTYSSLRAVERLRRREESMRTICFALSMMKSEMVSYLTSIPEIFKMLSRDAQYPARRLFENAAAECRGIGDETLYSIWKSAVEKTDELLLNDYEKAALCQVGACLGKYEVRDQAAILDREISRFEQFRKNAETDRIKNGRLHGYLGVLAGVFIVIVLL